GESPEPVVPRIPLGSGAHSGGRPVPAAAYVPATRWPHHGGNGPRGPLCPPPGVLRPVRAPAGRGGVQMMPTRQRAVPVLPPGVYRFGRTVFQNRYSSIP